MRALAAPDRRGAGSGAVLLDALVALLVMSLMVTALLQAEGQLQRLGETARRRGEAMQVAQQALERLRGPSAAASAPLAPATAGYALSLASSAPAGADAGGAWRDLGVQVRWTDSGGAGRQLRLATHAPPLEALHEAAAALAPQDEVIARPFARSTGVPPDARTLGEGRSLWQPAAPAALSWVLDDASGMVTARCGQAIADPRCEPLLGRALSGHVRFSLAAPPQADGPSDPPLDLALVLDLDRHAGETAECIASPTGLGAERVVRYGCVVGAVPPEGWSGQLRIVPQGWHIGPGAGDLRVCRYSTDLDRSGAIDRNDEHPARYRDVRGTLSQQNFLVIRGDQRCSDATTHNGAPPDLAPHQP